MMSLSINQSKHISIAPYVASESDSGSKSRPKGSFKQMFYVRTMF